MDCTISGWATVFIAFVVLVIFICLFAAILMWLQDKHLENLLKTGENNGKDKD